MTDASAPEPKSKRQPVRLRHKIEKASAAKQKKNRKLAKKNPEWRTRLKKDPGIPNLFPYKDKILAEIEERKRLREEGVARRREEAKLRSGRDGAADDDDAMEEDDEDALMDCEDYGDDEPAGNNSNPMAALLASARARAADFDHGANAHGDGAEDGSDDDEEDSWDGIDDDEAATRSSSKPARTDSSRKAFTSTFQQLLSSADVLLYVLDARDPLGTRSRAIERQVMAADSGQKRLILVLNKIDLVPPKVLRSWLVHLRRFFPTLPLRASNPAPNAKTWDHQSLTVKRTTETLVRALKSYGAGQGLKRSVSVGVIGYPNVGKSSVINALRARLGGKTDACPVGAEAGVTTNLREVKLDGKIKLIDSPGIVFPSRDEDAPNGAAARQSRDQKGRDEQARLILLNAVPPKDIDDPVPAVTLLLQRLKALSESAASDDTTDPYANMLAFYGIPALHRGVGADGTTDLTTDFLVQVARKRGRLGRGGVPNLNAAAFGVIIDWRDGRIQGWVDAPTLAVERPGEADVEMEGSGGGETRGNGRAPDQKTVVTEWAAEFRLEGLWGDGRADDGEAMAED